jgi:hypothetical protein
MSNLRLPYFWRGMSYTAKAAHLCETRQARDYSHACSILAGMKRHSRHQHRPTPAQFAARMEQMKLF